MILCIRRRRRSHSFYDDAATAFLLLLPCLIFLSVFAVYPVGRTIQLAFAETGRFGVTKISGYTLANILETVREASFWASVGRTALFVVTTVAAQTLLGLVLALVANKKFRAQGLARAGLLLPWATPPIVAATAWKWMCHDRYGLFNAILGGLGLTDGRTVWLASPRLAMLALILLAVWKVSSFMALLILAGLQSIPDDIYEAAAIDGASGVRTFFAITLPLVKPTILVAMLLRALQAIQVFDLPYALTDGGPGTSTEMLAMYIYRSGFISLNFGLASAQALMMLLLSLVLVATYFAVAPKDVHW